MTGRYKKVIVNRLHVLKNQNLGEKRNEKQQEVRNEKRNEKRIKFLGLFFLRRNKQQIYSCETLLFIVFFKQVFIQPFCIQAKSPFYETHAKSIRISLVSRDDSLHKQRGNCLKPTSD